MRKNRADCFQAQFPAIRPHEQEQYGLENSVENQEKAEVQECSGFLGIQTCHVLKNPHRGAVQHHRAKDGHGHAQNLPCSEHDIGVGRIHEVKGRHYHKNSAHQRDGVGLRFPPRSRIQLVGDRSIMLQTSAAFILVVVASRQGMVFLLGAVEVLVNRLAAGKIASAELHADGAPNAASRDSRAAIPIKHERQRLRQRWPKDTGARRGANIEGRPCCHKGYIACREDDVRKPSESRP
mmetsp:Transcript_65184/g.188983  ORF Transcript_65184/g.188983 Transcript_65184/m.188983 type:complete len:237 (+) Transcript_65184:540-1250(+)